MQLAIENFSMMKVPNKVLCLGAMRELGKESQSEHQALIELINKNKFEEVSKLVKQNGKTNT